MNWGLIWSLLALALFWGVVGYAAWHQESPEAIYTDATLPAQDDELWQLNFR
ncbi:hypothetical protein [Tautonia marina]|uniref:hypothetical protein n=1 Tax=Tautonia marina TaxID=2653855 RepID=UPI001375748D|nr:hypothetical protein [Tautonia marina]